MRGRGRGEQKREGRAKKVAQVARGAAPHIRKEFGIRREEKGTGEEEEALTRKA